VLATIDICAGWVWPLRQGSSRDAGTIVERLLGHQMATRLLRATQAATEAAPAPGASMSHNNDQPGEEPREGEQRLSPRDARSEAGETDLTESAAAIPGPGAGSPLIRVVSGWLGGARLGLAVMALVVGAGAGLAAAVFRWLIYAFTWLATGHHQFGQQGHAASLHVPWLGFAFLLVIPVVGGLLYGPLIQRFAREARGHGVPEVMLAVAENGGRIRPPVTIVKALASAMCIGTGGSVGREGPIVQVGSALASTLGQLVRMSENRLRIIVACGAAGGIAATFNAPITGLFFGFEIVLREFSLDALFATSLAAVTGDVISRAFFGSSPFFSGIPHGISVTSDYTYLLIIVLGIASGIIGVAFKAVLYKLEDLADELWKGRPEWARPAIGGLALGALLLALPQMYGVGYPVMDRAVAGHYLLWFVIVLMLGKILATSLTLSIGGSGGVFAPSLFIGAMAGMAFGVAAHHVFGPVIGPPAMYAVVAMGGVFGAAAQAPLTSIASVVEMTGNFTLTLPVMLATGIASALSKHLSYGSIYTTKLLRRGIDIDRPKTSDVLQRLTVADVMHRYPQLNGRGHVLVPEQAEPHGDTSAERALNQLGAVTDVRRPQAMFADETLEQALRQLVLYGHSGLPVLSHDGERVLGWVTRENVLGAIALRLGASAHEIEHGALAGEYARPDAIARVHKPSTPLNGYDVVEVVIGPRSPALGRRLSEITWPPGSLPVAVTEHGEVAAPRADVELRSGERIVLLTPTAPAPPDAEVATANELRGRVSTTPGG
jgi:CIC family chloride channel protein